MSRMAEHALEREEDDRLYDLEDCERWHREQEILKSDPAYALWLDSVNSRNKIDFPLKDADHAHTPGQ